MNNFNSGVDITGTIGIISSSLKYEIFYSFTENVTETWIGLYSNNTPVVFKWSDSTPVKLSHWHSQEPNTFQRTGQLCVSAQGPVSFLFLLKEQDRHSYFTSQ